jgi:chorismate mutase
MIRGVRGAITVIADQPEEILKETRTLILEMVKENKIVPDDVASVIISTTTDISSAFPAKAVRTIEDWTYVPVMCTHEMDVPGSMPLCIRVMMHVNTSIPQKEIQHIYLNEAVKLRPDLIKAKEASSL